MCFCVCFFFFLSPSFFFSFLEGRRDVKTIVLHLEFLGCSFITEIQPDIIGKADKYYRLLHSALIVTIIRLHSYSLVFVMSNNWQLCSVDAP